MSFWALEVRNLRKVYENGREALKGINLTIPIGDFFGLLGPNGAGKSTLISILVSLTRKTEGKVRIFGVDIDEDFPLARKKIGIVPQEFNFNIFEKVLQIVANQAGYYGLSYRQAKERAEYVLQELQLYEKRHEQARVLSGGMKRRLMIARALVHDPAFLILDEPTAGVDLELRRQLWHYLEKLNAQGKTILLTTHYLEEAESLCRHIAIIRDGEVVACKDKKSLLAMLDTTTLVLELERPLKRQISLPGVSVNQIDAETIELTFPSRVPMSKIMKLLERKQISFCSVKNKTNRLEELFLMLTQKEESHG
ncbi:MAG: ABC transporter ATP-binding protein [Leptospiraceae bacterium]|nr:ABC transporter ATP-binding protein [Leptospiraceae bacterium]